MPIIDYRCYFCALPVHAFSTLTAKAVDEVLLVGNPFDNVIPCTITDIFGIVYPMIPKVRVILFKVMPNQLIAIRAVITFPTNRTTPTVYTAFLSTPTEETPLTFELLRDEQQDVLDAF